MALTGKQRRYLRSIGQTMNVHVKVGQQGLTENCTKEIEFALEQFELVKVQLVTVSGTERKEVANEIAAKLDSELVQVLGSSVLLFRRSVIQPQIKLPS